MKQCLAPAVVLIVLSGMVGTLACPSHAQGAVANTAEGQLQKAVEYLGYGEYQLAAQACEQIITSYPAYEWRARQVLAEAYYGQGRFEQAIQQAELALEKVSQLYPDDSQQIAEAQAERERLVAAQQNFTKGVEELQKIIAARPGSAEAIAAEVQLGDVLLVYGRRQQAIEQYEKIIDDFPSVVEVVRAAKRLALACQMQDEQEKTEREKRFREEVAQLEETIASRPANAEAAQLKLGNTLFKYGKGPQAIAQYQKIIDEYPATAAAVRAADGLGMTYEIQGDEERAEAAYIKAESIRRERRLRAEVAQLQEIIAARPGSDEAVAAQLELGDVLLVYGRRQQAIEQYEKIIDEFPSVAEVVRAAKRLALARAMQNEQEKAERERRFREEVGQLKKTIASGGGTAQVVTAQLKLGNTLFKHGREPQAMAQYQKIIDEYLATAAAVRAADSLGMMYEIQGDQERAEAAYIKAESIRRERRLREEVAQLKEIIAARPGSAEAIAAQLQLGQALLLYGRESQAIAQYQKVINEYAATAEAVGAARRLALIYKMQGEEEKAAAASLQAESLETERRFRAGGRPRIAEYGKIIEQYPTSAEALEARYRIGSVYALYSKYDQAIEQFSQLIKEHPQSRPAAKAFSMLPGVFAQADWPEQGLEVLSALAQTYYYNDPQMLVKLCQFYRATGRPGQLIASAADIAGSFPESPQAPQALLMLCEAYQAAGRLQQLEATAQRTIQQYPDSDEASAALPYLVAIYEARVGLAAAVSKLHALAARYPDTRVATGAGELINQAAGPYYGKGFTLGSLGKYQQAIAQFDQALALGPPGEVGAQAGYQKAICYHVLGQKAAAIAEFKQVMQNYPDSYLSVRAQGWIERIRDK